MATLLSSIDQRQGITGIARLSVRGKIFEFRLCSKEISLGETRSIQNIWLNNACLRGLRIKDGFNNYGSIVSFTRCMDLERCLEDDVPAFTRYFLALCYPAIAMQKGDQKIYKNAFLNREILANIETDSDRFKEASDITRSNYLSEEECARIKEIAKSRSVCNVRKELDRVLGFFEAPTKLVPLLQNSMRNWVGKAYSIFKEKGNDGLINFISNELKPLINKYIKKGGNLWVRNFVYMFICETKLAYYSCYANCWLSLIPWLKNNWQINELTERFLRLWHNQNQSFVIPPGQTMARFLANQGNNLGGFRDYPILSFEPTRVRDVFNGQVLALHPLGNYLLRYPELRDSMGQFLMDDKAYNRVNRKGWHELSGSYWSFIEAILIAANQYRKDMELQRSERPTKAKAKIGIDLDHVLSSPNNYNISNMDIGVDGLFSALLKKSNKKCSLCKSELDFESAKFSDDYLEIALNCVCLGCKFSRPYFLKISSI